MRIPAENRRVLRECGRRAKMGARLGANEKRVVLLVLTNVLRAAHRMGRIGRDDLGRHRPRRAAARAIDAPLPRVDRPSVSLLMRLLLPRQASPVLREGSARRPRRWEELDARHFTLSIGRQFAFGLIQYDQLVPKRVAHARTPADGNVEWLLDRFAAGA